MRTRVSHGLIAAAILISFVAGLDVELRAQENPILFRQGGEEGKIFPLMGTISAEEFYNYSAVDYQARTPLEIPRYGMIILYRDISTSSLALMILLNAANAGPSGQVRLTIEGLPSTARLAVQDDPNDEYEFRPPTAQFGWRWASRRTDGAVITNLQEPFSLRITPRLTQGIIGWKLYTLKSALVGPERVPLPSLTEPITLSAGLGPAPQAAFRYTPEQVLMRIPVLFDARPSLELYGQIARYEWDFDGDGIFDLSSDQPLVSYTFSQSGTFQVTLRITDPNGFTSTVSQLIEVQEERIGGIWRTISTPQAQPASVFRVMVSFQVDVPSNGMGLEERWPVGWTIEPVRNDGAIFKLAGSRGQWVFPALLKTGEVKRIIYDVHVPPADEVAGPPLPARYSVQGFVTSVSPAYTLPVSGESEIEVVTCLRIPVAISHLDLAGGQVDLRGPERITPEQRTRALGFWASAATVPGTCDAPMSTAALLELLVYQLRDIPVDQPLPSVTVTPPLATVTRTITTRLPARQVYLKSSGAEVFQVELTVEARQHLSGLRIAEQLPEGWHARPLVLSNSIFKSGAPNEWIFPEFIRMGETRRLLYEVIVPSDAAIGIEEFTGFVESGLALFLTPIQGDRQVAIIECLSVFSAIAHLNVETGEIEVQKDNLISPEQSQAAFLFWLEEREVPGTCGQKLDLTALQTITSYMLTGTPVEK
jgi:PKD repeat protein